MKCFKYTPVNKGYCLGIAALYLEEIGLEIYGFSLLEKDGKRWINFPSRKYEDKETGETKHIPYIRFPDKERYVAFCEAAKKSIDAFKPVQKEPQKAQSVELQFPDEVPF